MCVPNYGLSTLPFRGVNRNPITGANSSAIKLLIGHNTQGGYKDRHCTNSNKAALRSTAD
jgi:hypothetical protein